MNSNSVVAMIDKGDIFFKQDIDILLANEAQPSLVASVLHVAYRSV